MRAIPDLKTAARRIFLQTLAGTDIAEAMASKLQFEGARFQLGQSQFDLSDYSQIVLIAFGKASLPMAKALLQSFPPGWKTNGIVVAPVESSARATISSRPELPPEISVAFAGHPTPDEQSFRAGRAILDLLATCDDRTIVFFLLSGGGSSLVELPLDDAISLNDVQSMNRVLVSCGAPIDEINSVRKHLSAVKGGRLAAAAGRATKLTLGITDVPAGRESALASGPTLPDPTTVADARRVIEQYSLISKLAPSIRSKFLEPGAVKETPKAEDAAFTNSYFEIMLGMHDLFHHAHIAAECEGFLAICDNSTDDWPVARAADFLLEQLAALQRDNPDRCVAVIADGELSSPVRGTGSGGRNSAFVLECVERIAGKRVAVMSVGTDGIDGNSPAAGAAADGETLSRARAKSLDPDEFSKRSDAYTFFAALDDAVMTGRTGNNLRDLRILHSVPETRKQAEG